jgi:hypothetical protein
VGAFTFDYALGREVELYNRVDTDDPTNSAFLMVVLAATGLEADTTLRTYATLSALLAGTSNEVTNGAYARKTLTQADLSAFAPNTTTHRTTLSLPLQTFTTIAAGDSWSKVLICYDSDTTGGTDANVLPVTAADLRISDSVIVPNGSNIVIDFSSGFVICS